MHYEFTQNGVIGLLPIGGAVVFPTVKDYEDAYYDQLYDLNNQFYREYPED